MSCFRPSCVAVTLAALLFLATAANAQRHGNAAPRRAPAAPKERASQKADQPLDKLQKMTPEQRRKALEKLPPDRRQAIEQRLQRLDKLTPEEKVRYEKFRELPPARQQVIRDSIGGLTKLPTERQQAVREELRQMRGLSPEDRAARLSSGDFKSRFSSHEQKLIENLQDVVPQ